LVVFNVHCRGGENMEDFYTPNEIADMLNVSRETIRRYLRQGKLRGLKFDQLWRVQKKDLDMFLASRWNKKEQKKETSL
jgi:excisionase family DNA binding protein